MFGASLLLVGLRRVHVLCVSSSLGSFVNGVLRVSNGLGHESISLHDLSRST